jgi:16S rRNA processing protein RimM
MRITAAFGVRGMMRAALFSDNIKFYKKMYDGDGAEFCFRIVRYIGGKNAIVSVDGICDRTTAESLKGAYFYVKKSDLPKISPNEFYVCDLVGRSVEIIGNGDVDCAISNVYNFGAGDLIEITTEKGTFMIPFTEENFPKMEGDSFFMTDAAFKAYKN